MRNQILGCYWAENAESLENKGIPRFSFRFESTSAHQSTANMQKVTHIAVFSFAFLNKYSLKNAFSVRFGEQFGEQNRSKTLIIVPVSFSAVFFGDPYGGLAVSTSWSLGKEKYSRIDARIFPNQWVRPTEVHSKKEEQMLSFLRVTLNQPKSNLFQNRLTLKRRDSIYCRAV